MKYWQLEEANEKLIELVQLAIEEGPRGISIREKEGVVLLSKKTYETLTGKKLNFIDFLKRSPLHGLPLELERDGSISQDRTCSTHS